MESKPIELQDKFLGSLIGQKKLKGKLKFFLEAYQKTQKLSNLAFIGSRGSGKTVFAKEIAKLLTNPETGKPKTLITINCGSFKKVDQIFDTLIIPHIANGKYATLFLDELHAMDKTVQDVFLSILDIEKRDITEYTHSGTRYEFDFRRLTVLAATTNFEKILPPLQDRFERMGYEIYTIDDICQIIRKNNTDAVSYESPQLLEDIASTARLNPRFSVRRAKEINQYTAIHGPLFTWKKWENLKKILSIYPKGLTEDEIKLMRILQKGTCKLHHLSHKMNLTPAAVSNDIERYLINLDFIKVIPQGRILTGAGIEYLDKLG